MVDIQPLCERIRCLFEKNGRATVAIDGPSAAGKTRLGERLRALYPSNVYHMDDFFLRPEQRTRERLGQPGGNIDYERFLSEVIVPMAESRGHAFRKYDCRTCELSAPVAVEPRPLAIVEGVYSLHPYFGEVFDVKVFFGIGRDEQLRRLRERDASLAERFESEWIPMETEYFDHFKIMEKCDFVIVSGQCRPTSGCI